MEILAIYLHARPFYLLDLFDMACLYEFKINEININCLFTIENALVVLFWHLYGKLLTYCRCIIWTYKWVWSTLIVPFFKIYSMYKLCFHKCPKISNLIDLRSSQKQLFDGACMNEHCCAASRPGDCGKNGIISTFTYSIS